MSLNQLLSGLANKLIEISENTADMETASELNELIESIVDSIQ